MIAIPTKSDTLSKRKASVSRYFARVSEKEWERHKSYLEYHKLIAPTDNEGILRRWQFAACSVRQSWQHNVKMFQAVASLPEPFTEIQLRKALRKAKTGFYNRAKGLTDLTNLYWTCPEKFQLNDDSWNSRLIRGYVRKLGMGLGTAKTSFGLEMLYPDYGEVVCLDRWILRMYGLEPRDIHDMFDYWQIEKHWLKAAHNHGLSPTMVRHMIWDDFHGKPNTRYWCHVFETPVISIKADKIFPPAESITRQSTHDSQQQEEWVDGTTLGSKAEEHAEAARQLEIRAKYISSYTRLKWQHSGTASVSAR